MSQWPCGPQHRLSPLQLRPPQKLPEVFLTVSYQSPVLLPGKVLSMATLQAKVATYAMRLSIKRSTIVRQPSYFNLGARCESFLIGGVAGLDDEVL